MGADKKMGKMTLKVKGDFRAIDFRAIRKREFQSRNCSVF